MEKYKVKSIFGPTLQGEGSYAGTVVLFLRFAGCNRWSGLEKDRKKSFCNFCDTDFRGGEPLSAAEILAKLEALNGPKRVVITGGEPTLQIDGELLALLRENGYEIHLETNGSKNLGNLRHLINHVTLSPKQSRELTQLEYCDDLKLLFPLPDSDVSMDSFGDFPSRQKFLQPVMDQNYESNLKQTISALLETKDWRLSLQTHKIAGVE